MNNQVTTSLYYLTLGYSQIIDKRTRSIWLIKNQTVIQINHASKLINHGFDIDLSGMGNEVSITSQIPVSHKHLTKDQ